MDFDGGELREERKDVNWSKFQSLVRHLPKHFMSMADLTILIDLSGKAQGERKSQLVKVKPFHLPPLRSEFNNATSTRTISSLDDLSKPCSSTTKTFYVNGRFNYFKKSL